MSLTLCSAASLRRSIDISLAALRGKKTIDCFQPARVDKAVTIEDTVKTLAALKDEGKFAHIGLSECAAATVRRAQAVSVALSSRFDVVLIGMPGPPNRCRRDRGQPDVLRGGDEER